MAAVPSEVATLPAAAIAASPLSSGESGFNLAQRQARALSASALVPASYRGPEGMPNVLLAMDVANRIGASPFAVMQNLHIVQGRPGWSSSFLIATVNACGRFDPLRFETVGSDPSAKDYRVRAVAKDRASGELCVGAWITWKMVDAEGWSKKNGSKWLTMPEQMFMYRAASFWTRVYAPEISLGIQTTEEVRDVWGGADTSHAAVAAPANAPEAVAALTQQLLGDDAPAPAQAPERVLLVDPDTGEVLPDHLQG